MISLTILVTFFITIALTGEESVVTNDAGLFCYEKDYKERLDTYGDWCLSTLDTINKQTKLIYSMCDLDVSTNLCAEERISAMEGFSSRTSGLVFTPANFNFLD